MSKPNKSLFSIAVLILAILACNMPGVPIPSNATPDFVATITQQAALIQSTANSQPPATQAPPAVADTSTPVPPTPIPATETPSQTPTITLTPTSSIPMLSVSANTNCRSGPSKNYDYRGELLIGESAEVVGKNTPTNYWIIKTPKNTGTCWLWGNFAQVVGDISKIPEVPIPPTPTPAIPSAVKNLTVNKICFFTGVNYKINGSISWDDVEHEDGYKVYFIAALFKQVGADVTTAPLPILELVPGGSFTMSVRAFNSAGKSDPKSILITCP